MQIVRERADDGASRLDELRLVYTPPMQRVLAHLPDALRHELIERMARHQLEQERAPRRAALVRCGTRVTRRRRPAAGSRAMQLAS